MQTSRKKIGGNILFKFKKKRLHYSILIKFCFDHSLVITLLFVDRVLIRVSGWPFYTYYTVTGRRRLYCT